MSHLQWIYPKWRASEPRGKVNFIQNGVQVNETRGTVDIYPRWQTSEQRGAVNIYNMADK